MKGNELIRSKREERGFSLRELARRAEVSHVHVKNLEEGISEPTFEVLIRILNALGVSLFAFSREIGYRPPTNRKAPGEGFEPPTKWLTATRSAG